MRPGGKTVKHLQIGGEFIALNKEQFTAYLELKEGNADPDLLEAFLASLPSDVADTVRTMIVFASTPLQEAVDAARESAPADTANEATGATKSAKGTHSGETTKPVTPTDEPPATDDDDDDGGGGIDLNTNLPL